MGATNRLRVTPIQMQVVSWLWPLQLKLPQDKPTTPPNDHSQGETKDKEGFVQVWRRKNTWSGLQQKQKKEHQGGGLNSNNPLKILEASVEEEEERGRKVEV